MKESIYIKQFCLFVLTLIIPLLNNAFAEKLKIRDDSADQISDVQEESDDNSRISDTLKETELQTVQKSLQDIRSDSAEIRRRAVMILGKYHNNRMAKNAVAGSLQDQSAEVRRAALVSLVEETRIDADMAIPVLNMLSDSDVHIRRIASSVIPQLLICMTPAFFTVNGKMVRQNPVIPPKTLTAVNKAFSDSDPSVRKNMVNYYNNLVNLIPPETLLPLLKDPEREIRINAVKSILCYLPQKKLEPLLKELSTDKDMEIRGAVAGSLGFRNMDDTIAGILNTMLGDEDKNIRAEAVVALLQHGKLKDAVKVEEVLNDKELDMQTGRHLIMMLTNLGKDAAMPVLKKILTDERAAFRSEALSSYNAIRGNNLDIKEISPYFTDPSSEVRRVACNIMLMRKDVDNKIFLSLAANPYPDVRMSLVIYSRNMPDAKAAQLFNELLLDDSSEVRKIVLQAYARRKLDGWLDILERSMEDTDVNIKAAAAEALLSAGTPEAIAFLKDYLKKNKDFILDYDLKNELGIIENKNKEKK